jgi:hypothetical protein
MSIALDIVRSSSFVSGLTENCQFAWQTLAYCTEMRRPELFTG